MMKCTEFLFVINKLINGESKFNIDYGWILFNFFLICIVVSLGVQTKDVTKWMLLHFRLQV